MMDGGNETMVLLDGMGDGLEAPDHILQKDGYYYISTGTTANTSSVARYNMDTGDFDLQWASGGPLMRPYGFAFDEETLYVASFMSDQILMYDSETGDYMGVFAEGDATEEGLCNGPNQIAIYNGTLFMTTQGSYVDENGDLQYAFASQIVQYDLETAEGSVFVPQPDPIGGFVSMLGILIMDDIMYTTDFAGGLRVYDMDGELLSAEPTAYAEGASTGSITTDGALLYVTGFTGEEDGAVMSFEMFAGGEVGALEVVYEGNPLMRPIGILYVEDDDMDGDGMGGGGDMEMDSPTTTPGMEMMDSPTAAPTDSGARNIRQVTTTIGWILGAGAMFLM